MYVHVVVTITYTCTCTCWDMHVHVVVIIIIYRLHTCDNKVDIDHMIPPPLEVDGVAEIV